MLTKIEVDDGQGHTLSLPFADVSAGYTIKNIDGLDPVKATIVSTAFAQLDGSQLQSARRENRNIILTLGIDPYLASASVKSLRAALYAYFMPKSFVKIKFFDENVAYATIAGQVESFETPLFARDPEVAVSILCPDPSFLAVTPITVSSNTVAAGGVETPITNPGSIEAGYVLTLVANRNLTGLSVTNRRPDNTVATLDITMAINSGDTIKISTVALDKYVKLTRSGTESSVIWAVSAASKFGPLWPGVNSFRIIHSAAGAIVPFSLVYTPRYGGL
jgi:hypothetical protein